MHGATHGRKERRQAGAEGEAKRRRADAAVRHIRSSTCWGRPRPQAIHSTHFAFHSRRAALSSIAARVMGRALLGLQGAVLPPHSPSFDTPHLPLLFLPTGTLSGNAALPARSCSMPLHSHLFPRSRQGFQCLRQPSCARPPARAFVRVAAFASRCPSRCAR